MLHQLDGVTIWVDDERDRDRPSIQSFWLHSGLEARSHGGIVHGIGNALFEKMGYDDEAQPVTGTFADYLLPTATEIPNIEVVFIESPSPTNPIGVKGIGEAGTIPVAPAIVSAIEDALSPWGVHLAEAPVSPVRLLELIDGAAPA